MKSRVIFFLSAALAAGLVGPAMAAGDMVARFQEHKITGGLVVQVGSADLSLQSLGEGFHVRFLLPDDAAVAKAQAAIDQAGLSGRFTVSVWSGGTLPFADRVINVLILPDAKAVAQTEAQRALRPGGLLIAPDGQQTMPVPPTIDEWTHFFYDASGNAVSKDQEVAPPRSFRWHAPPLHQRSHDWGSSFMNLVTANGRLYHLLDESPSFFAQGGIPERWSLVARDAFNGALLWKRPLAGYDYAEFESSGHQKIWRAPLSLNRRTVAQGDHLIVSLSYRDGPLSILDGATGKTLREINLQGSVDEIIAGKGAIICRVRERIPPESEAPVRKKGGEEGDDDESQSKGGKKGGKTGEDEKTVWSWNNLLFLRQQKERVVAVDESTGKILWERPAPAVANEALAMADGIVVYHNYDALIALDAATGKELWRHPTPLKEGTRFGIHNLLGTLLIAGGRVVWASNQTGGIGLNLADGKRLWTNPRVATPGGFQFPVAQRVIGGVLYGEQGSILDIATGQSTRAKLDIGDMLRRGHHTRCFPGKATQRYLITPHRGAEFVDLIGDNHMVHDWIRGACSHGNLPANGLFYVTPDPCVCYAGAKIIGFQALAAALPGGLDSAPPEDDASRLTRGPAWGKTPVQPATGAWSSYRSDARRLNQCPSPLSANLKTAWTSQPGGNLTQASIANGRCFLADKDRYQLLCLDMKDGRLIWKRSFPAALDGPPTIVGECLFLGCRSGEVFALNAADGASVWTYRAAPLERLTLADDQLENIWPAHSSVLYQNGLIYALAGRNSQLDGGLRLVALDPATGQVRRHYIFEGPRPTKEQLRAGVISPPRNEKQMPPDLLKSIQDQYATGYSIPGGNADVLVGDGKDIFLTQNRFTADLQPVPLKREDFIGITNMGALHMMAQHGFLDDSFFHRGYQQYDDHWMSKAGGAGSAARGGNMVAVGKEHAYAAKHYTHDWYPGHKNGSGNRIVCDPFTTKNERGDKLPKELGKKLGFYNHASALVRTAKPTWEITLPIIVRSMLVAPDGKGGELVFIAGIVEGANVVDWVRAAQLQSQAKLYVLKGSDGQKLSELDLPACPVFDGLSAAHGKLLAALVNGQLVSLGE